MLPCELCLSDHKKGFECNPPHLYRLTLCTNNFIIPNGYLYSLKQTVPGNYLAKNSRGIPALCSRSALVIVEHKDAKGSF